MIVDQIKGPIKTIDEALELCSPNTDIYLEEGVYFISSYITKAGLIFQKFDVTKDVYILGNKGPVI